MKITTNNQYRPILHWDQLTEEEQNLRYGMYDGIEESSFFEYKDCVYDLNDFLRVNDHLNGKGQQHDLYGWDGYYNESFFSSVVVKYSECGDSVRVGLATSQNHDCAFTTYRDFLGSLLDRWGMDSNQTTY